MLKQITIGIMSVCISLTSIKAIADDLNTYSPTDQQVVIPGYTPPTSSTQPNAAARHNSSKEAAPQPSDSTTIQPASASGVPTQQEMYQSCQKLIAVGSSIDVVKKNLQGGFEEQSSGDIYRWSGPGIIINFLSDGTPVEAHGNLPAELGSVKALNFKLDDVVKALNGPGELQGHFYIFTLGGGQIKIQTDSTDTVTGFSTNVSCELKK